MDQIQATSIAGYPFDKSQRMQDGTIWHVLHLKGLAAEVVLATAWIEFAKSDQLKTIWPAGPLTPRQMIELWTRPEVAAFGAFVQTPGSNDIQFVGLGWAMEISPIGMDADGKVAFRCELGMDFLPSIHGTGLPQEMAEAMIDYGFEKLNLKIMYGTTPVPNVLARRFARRLGLQFVATLPSFACWPDAGGVLRPCDCEVNVISRDAWVCRSLDKIDDLLSKVPEDSYGRA